MTEKNTKKIKSPSWNKTLDHFIKALDIDKKDSLYIHSILEKKKKSIFRAELEFKSAKKEIEIQPTAKRYDRTSSKDTIVPRNLYIDTDKDKPKTIKTGFVYKNKKEFIEEAEFMYGPYYDYSMVEIESSKDSKKIKIICPKHGEFTQTIKRHLSGTSCPKCAVEPGSPFSNSGMVKKQLDELAKQNKKFKLILLNDANYDLVFNPSQKWATGQLGTLILNNDLYNPIAGVLEENGYLFILEHSRTKPRARYLNSSLIKKENVELLESQQCSLNAVVRFICRDSRINPIDNLYIFKKSKDKKIFIAEKKWPTSSENEDLFFEELNIIADNLKSKTDSGKIEKGLVKEQKEFKGIAWLKAEIKAEDLKSNIKGRKQFSFGQLILEENKIKTNGETRIQIEPKENSLYFTEYREQLQRLRVINEKYLFIPRERSGLTPPEYVLELKLNKTVLLAEYFPVYLSHEIAKDFGKLLNFNNFKDLPVYLIPLKDQPKYIANQEKLLDRAKRVSEIVDEIANNYSNEPSRAAWAIEKLDEMISAGEELSANEERAQFILDSVKAAEENESVEFKYSFVTDYNENSSRKSRKREVLKDEVLVAINSFLNTAGGSIILGVADRTTIDKHGANKHLKNVLRKKEIEEISKKKIKPFYIVGVEPDLEKYKGRKLTYKEVLDEAITVFFESSFRIDLYIKKSFVDVEGFQCFQIDVESYYEDHKNKEIVCWRDPDRDPYYRKGDKSLPLKGKTLTEWIDN